MSSTTELARREERAQGGIIQFAEEMQAIRDGNLYPGAKQEPDAWPNYCKDRWNRSASSVDGDIRALPVLKRFTVGRPHGELPKVEAAQAVATLPEPVQDAILSTTAAGKDAKAKAKAVRDATKKAAHQGVELTDDEQVEVVKTFKPKAKKKPKGMKDSRFITLASPALHFIEEAADYAQSNVLSDTENDWAWALVEKFRYHTDRIADKLDQPEHVKDIDEAFALLVEEMER